MFLKSSSIKVILSWIQHLNRDLLQTKMSYILVKVPTTAYDNSNIYYRN